MGKVKTWPLVEYLHWKETKERLQLPDGRCCSIAHCNADGTYKKDEVCCPIEVSWRVYVRQRDGNPQFPFDRNAHDISSPIPTVRTVRPR